VYTLCCLQHTENRITVRGSVDRAVAFIKVEDAKSRFRPQFAQFDHFPAISLNGNLSCGIFSATQQRKCSPKMPVKHYCELCDVTFERLETHIVASQHKRFASTQFSSLDQDIKELALNSLDFSVYDGRHSNVDGRVNLVDYSSTDGSLEEDVVYFYFLPAR